MYLEKYKVKEDLIENNIVKSEIFYDNDSNEKADQNIRCENEKGFHFCFSPNFWLPIFVR